ncbi:Nitrogen regulation protein NtrY [hydrothermal vent metagenome]|uniref:histidine kinase n=1 Tax=hydrothermal vent metagenome TaxID=652676 RepID=A0A3B0VCC6_9ZZZZ
MNKTIIKNSLIFLLVLVLLSSLYFLGRAVQGAEQFNRIYLWLFGASILAVLILGIIIIQRLIWLYIQHRKNAAGIKLTSRMVKTFIALSLPPVLIVYLFSTQFLNNYIDSWFDTKTSQALNDSLELGQIFLDAQTRQALIQTRKIAKNLAEIDEPRQAIYLEKYLDDSSASSLILISASGNSIGQASNDFDLNITLPPQSAYRDVRNGNNFVRTEPKSGGQLQIRTLVKIDNVLKFRSSYRYLQGLFAIQSEYSNLAHNIETASIGYNQQKYQREQLKSSFNIILALVLMLSMLLALIRAFSSAKKLVAPVRLLSKATQAIAEGDYSQKIPVNSKDEIGFLVKSFNTMSSQLEASSALAHRAQTDAISQKWYLESVLSHLSSGVLSINNEQRILMANAAANKILNLAGRDILNQNIEFLAIKNKSLSPFVELIITKLKDHSEEWQQETLISENDLRRVLVVRGSRIPKNEQEEGGLVVVFDDQTIINQAQRDAAWSEVARRLAHEVKNPLTPIQLSAERLRLRFLNKLPEEDKDILDRATQTIVSQVENLKTLVNAFSDYAKAPELKREPGGLNQLIKEAIDLYFISHAGINFQLDLVSPEPTMYIDKVRFSQLMTNLIKNSQESAGSNEINICIKTSISKIIDNSLVIKFSDDGKGFNQKILKHLFEPYETTKVTGSGLGLAIVKKIVEEHGGNIKAYNQGINQDGGAVIEITLPIYQPIHQK